MALKNQKSAIRSKANARKAIANQQRHIARVTDFHNTMTVLSNVLKEIKKLQKQAKVKSKNPKLISLTLEHPLDTRGSQAEHELLAHIGSKYSHAFAARDQHYARMYLLLAKTQLAQLRRNLSKKPNSTRK